SRFAGAARQLDAALLVNPNDIDEMADAIRRALTMRSDERRERWEAMMAVLHASDVDDWYESFLAALAGSGPTSGPRRPAQIPFRKAWPPYVPERQPNTPITPKPGISSTTAIASTPASPTITSNTFGIAAAKSS